MPSFQSRRWCFTINNPTDSELTGLQSLVSGEPDGTRASVSFLIFGRECGESGTPHLQGYLELTRKISLGGVKKLPGLSRSHLESAKGTASDSIAYCSKEDTTPFRAGVPYDVGGGDSGRDLERKRWTDARDAAVDGRLDDIPADLYIRCKRSFDEIADAGRWSRSAASRPRRQLTLRPWQDTALSIVQGPVDDRKIHFFVDPVGSAGKSTFCHHVIRDEPGCLILSPSRGVDLCYILRDPPRVVVFDCPRSTQFSDFPWSFVESLKDGYVVSTKYAGLVKSFSPATVIVMCNTKLWLNADSECAISEDRLSVIDL